MSQYSLWLWPLLFGSIFGLINSLKTDKRWSAPFIFQNVLIALCAVIGLTVGPELIWTVVGWSLFAFFNFGRAVLISSILASLNLLRPDKALKSARLLAFIAWGNPARFWKDLALIQADYLAGNRIKAQDRTAYWVSFQSVPRVSELLVSHNMMGKSLLRDWSGVIADYEACCYDDGKNKKQNICPTAVVLYASRAYAELGLFKESADALESADIPAANYPLQALDSTFIAFFALTGSVAVVDELIKKMSKTKSGMPEFARLYWRGRAYYANDSLEEAVNSYRKALAIVPTQDKAWSERIDYRLAEALAGSGAESLSEEKKEATKRGEKIMRRCYAVSDILNSRGKRTGVGILSFILVAVFVFISGCKFLGNGALQDVYAYAFGMGVLSGDYVLHGDWWRLITYQFLHANVSHLLMNIFGLIFLGKSVENIFGTRRFLAIYFVSGVLSGLAQMLICPEQLAVGASGAVMGIFGAGAAATFRLKKVLPANIRKNELRWMLSLAITQIMFDQIVNFASIVNSGAGNAVRIASFAHIGGMVSGFILGFMLPMRKIEE